MSKYSTGPVRTQEQIIIDLQNEVFDLQNKLARLTANQTVDVQGKSKGMKWVKASERLPEKEGGYITIDKDNEVSKFWFSDKYPVKWEWLRGNNRTGNVVGSNSHIVKWLDECPIPEKAKTAKQILQEKIGKDVVFSLSGDITICKKLNANTLVEAMEEYASHPLPQEGFTMDEFFKWAFENYHWNGESFEENTGHDDFETFTPSELYQEFITSLKKK